MEEINIKTSLRNIFHSEKIFHKLLFWDSFVCIFVNIFPQKFILFLITTFQSFLQLDSVNVTVFVLIQKVKSFLQVYLRKEFVSVWKEGEKLTDLNFSWVVLIDLGQHFYHVRFFCVVIWFKDLLQFMEIDDSITVFIKFMKQCNHFPLLLITSLEKN